MPLLLTADVYVISRMCLQEMNIINCPLQPLWKKHSRSGGRGKSGTTTIRGGRTYFKLEVDTRLLPALVPYSMPSFMPLPPRPHRMKHTCILFCALGTSWHGRGRSIQASSSCLRASTPAKMTLATPKSTVNTTTESTWTRMILRTFSCASALKHRLLTRTARTIAREQYAFMSLLTKMDLHLQRTFLCRSLMCSYVTERIQHVADVCCSGRVVSVLEGGYGRFAKKADVLKFGMSRATIVRDQLAGE